MTNPVLEFVPSLVEQGQLLLTDSNPPTPADLDEACCWLLEWEQLYRHGLPGIPPEVDPNALRWSLRLFYHAGQMLVYRAFDASELQRPLGNVPSKPGLPEAHYSVDLLGRFLPEFLRLATAASPHDPLVTWLRQVGEAWPLSGAGLTGAQPEAVRESPAADASQPSELRPADSRQISSQPWFAHSTLRRLYLDRLIAQGNGVPDDDPVLVTAYRDRLGAFETLAPRRLVRV